MDAGSLLGLLLALAGILAGLLLEGGNLGQILQPTAAMIVFGGTLGAVLLQFPFRTVRSAALRLLRVFFHRDGGAEALLRTIVNFANKARRKGIVSLDQDLSQVADPFLRQALTLAVDGTDPSELRHIMEVQIDAISENEARIPAVFESAGGFSPTIGIIGAVIGLIQVMQHLDHMSEVGRGIAVAFVATIYGVGAANLFFLPAAGKLRQRAREDQRLREMALEGVISIVEGLNPRMIEIKLAGFQGSTAPPPGESPQIVREKRA
ncbi:MAG: flagellar motor protein [Acidobacteriota bacterium]